MRISTQKQVAMRYFVAGINKLPAITMNQHLDFYSSHRQFYLCDSTTPFDTDSETFWTEEADKRRLAIGTNILGIATASYGHVQCDIQIIEKRNDNYKADDYDHIVECPLKVPSGVLQIFSCLDPTSEFEMTVSPGVYGVRIYSKNLATVIDEDGDDSYLVEIWPTEALECRVLRQYNCR
ncbi:MAG: hypothetical protein V4511_00720 [Bacteroidota bacterium]